MDASKPIRDGNTPLTAACNSVCSQVDHPPQKWAQVVAGAKDTVRFLLSSDGGVKPDNHVAGQKTARHPLVLVAHHGELFVV